jgi:hypothetical protein
MLQRVALGQGRFNIPGLTVDARGVVGGRQLASRFASMDRLVGFFRALTVEQNLDDLQPGVRIVYARGTTGTREAIVLLPASLPRVADVVARATRLAGGQCFTGAGRHFVQCRDAIAPLGYDVEAVSSEEGDFVLYGAEHDVAYKVESELPMERLLARLSLQRTGAAWPAAGPLLLVARRGLGPVVAEYLHRVSTVASRGDGPALRASGASCETAAGGVFSAPRTLWLFRLEGAPPRMRGLLTGTPGLELYVPVTEAVAVAAGHRHPIALESCRSSFPSDRLTLFSARAEGVLEIAPLPVFTPIEDIVRIRPAAAPQVARTAARAAARPDVTVSLQLVAAADSKRRAVAALVPWARVPWLRRLCYALPAPALRGYRVAVLERGVLVLAADVLEGLPFGVLLAAAAPGVLVPVGTRLRPAISPELLAERLGLKAAADGDTGLVVYPALGEPPFLVPAGALEALDRRVLSAMTRPEDAPVLLPHAPAAPDAAIEIENEPLGPMPLWGLEDRTTR